MTKTVGRGVVLVTKGTTISAVVSQKDAESMRRRFGGIIVSAKGMKYRIAQKTLRVLSDPEERAAVLATANWSK